MCFPGTAVVTKFEESDSASDLAVPLKPLGSSK